MRRFAQMRMRPSREVIRQRRNLVIEKTPLHSEQQITGTSRCATAIFADDFDWKLQLELYVRQSVVEVEQWCVHLGFARRPLEDEWDIDYPTGGWRWLRIIRYKWRPGLCQTNRQQPSNTEHRAINFQCSTHLNYATRPSRNWHTLDASMSASLRSCVT